LPLYNTAWESEAYNTVSGQSSNNSIRVSNAFMQAVIDDLDWDLIAPHNWQPLPQGKKHASSGTKLLKLHGSVPILGCNSIRL